MYFGKRVPSDFDRFIGEFPIGRTCRISSCPEVPYVVTDHGNRKGDYLVRLDTKGSLQGPVWIEQRDFPTRIRSWGPMPPPVDLTAIEPPAEEPRQPAQPNPFIVW